MKLLIILIFYFLLSSCNSKKVTESSTSQILVDSQTNKEDKLEIVIENKVEKPIIEHLQSEIITINVKNKIIMLSLENPFEKPIFYTSDITFERWNSNKWETLKFIDTYISVSMEYILQPNDKRNHPFYFNSFSKPIMKGKYRVIKSYYFDDKIKKSDIKEFTIN